MTRKILLGITGSIAAYKSAEIASGLTQAGYDVWVVMTKHADFPRSDSRISKEA